MVSFTQLISAALLATSALAVPHKMSHSHFHHQRSSSSSGGKRGAAYNDASLVHVLSGSNSTVGWAYDWNMAKNGGLPSDIEYVPMLWGAKMFGGWAVAIETALSSGSKYILGFNEPDMSSQASMTADEAASAYKNHITPYSGKAKLVSPSVTNSGSDNMGLSWMKSFLNQCSDCKLSGLAVHWYGESADDFKSFVNDAISLAKNNNMDEVWVTEFALNSDLNGGSTSKSAKFLAEVVPWLESQDTVTRYAYYMCKDGYLLSGNGLSESGQAYLS
ncbi:hypothetical protein ASPWEDRAFT_120489 [Aspergillus wentii DTO 134E9]|uniref:Asl1-like glycosyl hydrolase catalytic domain-containing protein n=1 Tax=Aspergillus wentii DTO 134E9 TaxID=1073089 RepID=A0A1L9R635_ASPWE|nr:uncharacterized protein ASPWEDRAFT_120489 [Aspergillus wentii DTO 134E9]KAI9925133.1 hypothetical protein MW887_006053 [Aspergillus wentii]OJJ30381.1 hypothetical protein ASPWEDRAFT_120489 [Aspergillus wentii DTO 134E9]